MIRSGNSAARPPPSPLKKNATPCSFFFLCHPLVCIQSFFEDLDEKAGCSGFRCRFWLLSDKHKTSLASQRGSKSQCLALLGIRDTSSVLEVEIETCSCSKPETRNEDWNNIGRKARFSLAATHGRHAGNSRPGSRPSQTSDHVIVTFFPRNSQQVSGQAIVSLNVQLHCKSVSKLFYLTQDG